MRVFVGTAEIAGMMQFLTDAFRSLGHEVTSCVDNGNSGFYDYNYDMYIRNQEAHGPADNVVVRRLQKMAASTRHEIDRWNIFRKVRDEYDLFVFIWNGLLPNTTWDYEYLSKHDKKIVSIFVGSDVRHVSAFVQEFKLDASTWEKWFHDTDLNAQLFRLRKAELYSNHIFSVPDQSGLAIRPYSKILIPFNTNHFKFNIPAREVPKILHIPSRTGVKGTAFILDAMKELERDGLQFEFQHISGVPNERVKSLLSDADILIDELYLHGPGTLSLEGIASGCAVATKTITGEVFDSLLCNIDFDNFKSRITRLITDVEYRVKLTNLAYDGIRQINNPSRIASDIVAKAFSRPESVSHDYVPRFFSEHYTLPQGVSVDKRNRQLTRNIIQGFDLVHQLNVKRMQEARLM